MAISTQYGGSPDRFGQADYDVAKVQGLSDLQILTWMNQNLDKVDETNLPGGSGGLYDQVLGGIQQEQDARIQRLNDELDLQQIQYRNRFTELEAEALGQQKDYQQQLQQYQVQARTQQEQLQQYQAQARTQQEVYQQQLQQYQNQANAYVPPSEVSAQDDNNGAMRRPAAGSGRKRLSSLAIIEGLGTNANPLSGLQLA